MAKKQRSQRRKDKDDAAAAAGDKHADADFLPEEFTIADSTSQGENLEEEYLNAFDGDGDADVVLLERGSGGGEAALAAAKSRLQALQDVMVSLDEFAQESRSARREAILRKVFKSLAHSATGQTGCEAVSSHRDSLLAACSFSLRPGSAASEQYAACRVLEAASVVMGANEEEWVDDIDKPLRRTVMTASRAVPVRMAALRALAMAVTVCASQDSVAAEGLQDLCESVAAETYRNQTVPAALRAAALDCWALLATLQDDVHLGQDEMQMGRGLAILHQLSACLEDKGSMDLRSAAGECLALIHEARLNLGIALDDNTQGLNSTARRFQKGSWEGSQFEVLMDEVKQRIAELSVESTRHMSKKAKKEQRATFREYGATIVEDEAPEEVINFRGGSLTLTSWREIVQLNFVRHCLQSGFQIQLLTNATLQSMFGADGSILGSNQAGLSAIEKRLVLSKTSEASKLADKDLRGRRDKRDNIKNYFLTADGEDL